MSDKRDANANTPRKPRAKAMAAVVGAPAPANTEIRDLKVSVASLAAMMADLTAKVIIKRKKTILDSGANISIISDFSHLDPNTPYCTAEEPRGVETANQSVIAISGSGTFLRTRIFLTRQKDELLLKESTKRS